MKNPLLRVGMLVLLMLVTSTGAFAKTTLVVTSYGGAYDETFRQYVVEPFEAAYPDIEVQLAPYTGVTKLEAQKNRPSVDIVQLDDFDIIDAADKGLLFSLRAENITNFNDMYPQALLKGSDGVVYGLTNVFGAWGIAYNTDKIQKPSSWMAFWDKSVAGRVAMMDNWIPDMLMAAWAFGGDAQNMEPAWKAIADLVPSVKQFYGSFSAPQALLESGEVWMASWFDGRTFALQSNGVPVNFVVPEEGGILIRGGLGVVKGSENREAAEKLVDFAMSVKAQRAFSEKFYYGPTNKTVTLDADLANIVVYGDDDLAKLRVPDWPYILSQREAWLEQWSRAMFGM